MVSPYCPITSCLKLYRHDIIFLIIIISLFPFSISAQDYIIGENDVLRISVYDNPDLITVVRVSGEGTILFPLIGEVKVGGLTVSQVSKKLGNLLADGYIVNPQVIVFIEQFRSKGFFYITGEVKKPDAYKFEEGTTVIKAITMAGGFTDKAATKRIKLKRHEEGKETILERVGFDDLVRPNDVIIVPESFF